MTALNKGFSIALDDRRRLLKIQVWGFWDIELAQKYRKALTEKIEDLQRSGTTWYALADFRGFFPRSEEVQDIIGQQFVLAEKRGMKKIGFLGEQTIIELLFSDIFQNSSPQAHSFFVTESDAIQWLINDREFQIKK